jgi:hypothetical protein
VGNEAGGYKIWRNPGVWNEPPEYMGEFYPPKGRITFIAEDLSELGFPAGHYTVLTPSHLQKAHGLQKWQSVWIQT